MPRYTPASVVHTRGQGAEVILHGEFDDARFRAHELATARPDAGHPYDDGGRSSPVRARSRWRCWPRSQTSGAGGADRRWRNDRRHGTAARGMSRAEVIGQTTRFPPCTALNGITAEFGSNTIADGIAVSTRATPCRSCAPWSAEVLLVDEVISSRPAAAAGDRKDRGRGAGVADWRRCWLMPPSLPRKENGLVLSGGNIDPLMLADLIELRMRTG